MDNFYWSIPVLAGVISGSAAVYSRSAGSTATARWLTWTMVAVAAWSLGYALELKTPDLEAKLFWSKLQYPGVVAVAPFYFLFAVHYAGKREWLTPRRLALLWIIPILALFLTMTNEAHRLIWSDWRLDQSGPIPMLELSRAPLYWILVMGAAYVFTTAGTVLLVLTFIKKRRRDRKKYMVLLLGVTVPWLCNIVFHFGLSPWPRLDLTTFAFALTGLVLAWGVFRLSLLEIIPLAREALIENMRDAVIVLSLRNHIVDINAVGRRLCDSTSSDPIGLSAERAFSWFSEINSELESLEGSTLEVSIAATGGVFDLSLTGLQDSQGRPVGRMLVLRDVSDKKKAAEALLESQERYWHIFNNAPTGIFEIDLVADCFVSINEAACEYLGYSRDEFLAMRPLDILTPESQRRFISRYERLIGKGYVEPNPEYAVRTKDGAELWVILNISYIWEGERLRGATIVAHDITERRKNEAVLLEWEEKYRTLVDNVAEGLLVVLAGRIVFHNRRMRDVSGYASPELDDMDLLTLFPKEVRKQVDENCLEVLAGRGSELSEEYPLARKNGPNRWVRANAVRISWAGEAAVLMFLNDVTERRAAEEALRESEIKYRTLVDNLQDGVFIIQDSAIQVVNGAFARMIGRDEKEVMGLDFGELVVPGDSGPVLSGLEALLNGSRAAREYEFRMSAATGDPLLVNMVVSPAPYRGRPAGIGAVRDITEQKRIQAEKARLEETLQQAQKMEAVGTLASGIAHDFNNILQAVSGYLELVRLRTDQDLKTIGYVSEIGGAVERAAELVNRLLTFSRKVEASLRPTDLNYEIEQTVKILERTIPKMIRVETHIDPELNMIKADPNQIEQILLNLGSNAKDAMPEGGTLTIRTENLTLEEEFCKSFFGLEPGDYVGLTVQDAGRGMDRQTLEHAFEPFFTTKGVGEGTGLGLAIVYGIVKSHGGAIVCESEEGRGATFRIFFQALDGQDKGRERESEASKGPPTGHELVLVVDDEKAIREVAREFLQENGYRVVEAESGERALEVLAEHQAAPDLILLDLGMPGMGGMACLKEIMSSNPAAKVLVASGYAGEDHSHETINSGARGFIKKPYRLGEMIERVRQVLDD